MAEHTAIGWCDSTANLWIGCKEASAACDHCYARELAERYGWVTWGADRIHCKQGWNDLRKWQRAAAKNGGVDPKLGRRRFVFINSLSDFFDNHRSVIWRADAWQLFRECTHLVLILVTKRPQLIRRELPDFWEEIAHRVYIVTTTEDQANADWRVPALIEQFEGITPPAVLGVSVEPMIGPVDLTALPSRWGGEDRPLMQLNALTGRHTCGSAWEPAAAKISWVIVGGESGKKPRVIRPAWVDAVAEQCNATGAAFFFKQWGEWAPMDAAGIASDGPVTSARGEVADWMHRKVRFSDGRTARLRAHSFTEHSTNLMYRVGTKKAGCTLRGRVVHQFPDERMAA